MKKSNISSEYSRIWRRRIVFLILLCVFILIGAMVSTHIIQVDRKTLVSTNLPLPFHNLKIVFAGDFLYNGKNDYHMNEAIHAINSSRADIVILGGNYGNNPANSLKFFDIIPNIHARYGVFAVLGKEDIDAENRDDFPISTKLKQKNITLLKNQAASIKNEGKSIYIVGLDEYTKGNPDYSTAFAKVNKEDFVIFACHSYQALNDITSTSDETSKTKFADISLIASTLGGQYAFGESYQRALNPIQAPKYFSGWHNDKGGYILVTNGVGVYSGFRFTVRPQIHEITVKYR